MSNYVTAMNLKGLQLFPVAQVHKTVCSSESQILTIRLITGIVNIEIKYKQLKRILVKATAY